MSEETANQVPVKAKDISVFEINKLMLETYTKIAKWHNDDATGAGLKILSTELIEDIAGAAFTHLGIPYKGARIKMDEEIRKKVEAEKEKLRVQDGLIPPPPAPPVDRMIHEGHMPDKPKGYTGR